MPANKKHLTKSGWQRFAKISAGFLGGYLVTVSFFMALAYWIDHREVLLTLRFGGFILWAGLLVVAFLGKNGWKTWGIYLLLTAVFSLIIYFSKIYHPIL